MAMKYGNKKTLAHGRLFASKREAKRYGELRLLLKAGQILDLQCQPVIQCAVNGQHVCNYIADFLYYPAKPGSKPVFEDSKGYRTAIYRLKKKLVKACTGIEIVEV